MLRSLRRFLRISTGYRFIEVSEESSARITLAALGIQTTVDRAADVVVQGGRKVATSASIKDIHLFQPRGQEGPPNWFISLRLQGGRRVELGSVTDSTDASIIAAKLATVTGRPVRLS